MEAYIANALVLLGVLVTYLQLRRERREEMQKASDRHAQNVSRLDSLREFHKMQLDINHLRDEQLTELKVQTARLIEISIAQSRRLEMLEDRQ